MTPSKHKGLRSALPPLEPAPAYLHKVPDKIIEPGKGTRGRNDMERRLIAWLRARRIAARPTLYEIEAERARRGMRPGLSVWAGSPLPLPYRKPEPLPMPPRIDLDEVRAQARRNRARIGAALGLALEAA